jgi:hypothetical protein
MAKIQCTVTGLWFGVTSAQLQRRIAEAGSLDVLKSSYVCRDARRARKEGKSDDEIRQLAAEGKIVSNAKAPGGKRGRKPGSGKKQDAGNEPAPVITEA